MRKKQKKKTLKIHKKIKKQTKEKDIKNDTKKRTKEKYYDSENRTTIQSCLVIIERSFMLLTCRYMQQTIILYNFCNSFCSSK